MRAAFHTLGCKVNQYETEALKEEFAKRGATIVSGNDIADVYIINTCTVTNTADKKSRQYVRRSKKKNPNSLVVVTGCYAQISPKELEEMPEVDIIIGINLKSQICDEVYALMKERKTTDKKRKITKLLIYSEIQEYDNMGIVSSSRTEKSRAYIKIQDGCNRFCSYCIIPYARGNIRSRDPGEIIREAQLLIDEGFKEIVLTGINTALYGREPTFNFIKMPGEDNFSGIEIIIKRLNDINADFRIRLSSLEPNVVDEAYIEQVIKYDKLCHHLHLALQSGSNHVLKLMNRGYTEEEYFGIVRMLRDFDPEYGITTDIIVGFPGETEQDFNRSLEMIRRAEFGRVHGFKYSARKNTKAAEMGETVECSTKNKRIEKLLTVAEVTAEKFNKKNFGKSLKVLFETEDNGIIEGYSDNYIKVYAKGSTDNLNDFYMVKPTINYKDGCFGEIIGRG